MYTIELKNVDNCIKPLHGVNCAPYLSKLGENQTVIKDMFTRANIPFSRLHDVMGAYGGTYFVDVPNIFRDFSADENDPASYDFYYSDEYIKPIIESGTEVVYRLGVTIEWGSRKYRANPPEDMEKWARICEHIIMHYNCGWCDGHEYNIKYWEIWNEPENPPMWTGTMEQFFRLYEITSKHLRKRFPDIKIGGYGSCGFYAVTNPYADDFYKSFITWFDEFLPMCREKNCPLDFYSWHIYSFSPLEVAEHARYVRRRLDEEGFYATESHLNEWNYMDSEDGFARMHNEIGASFLAAAISLLHREGTVDAAMYYVFSHRSSYTGFIDQNTGKEDIPFRVFVSYGKLYAMKKALDISFDGPVYAVAAENEGKILILVTNYSAQAVTAKINLPVKGIDSLIGETVALNDNEIRLEAYATAEVTL
ncbi:MAG: hypothetical protein GX633_08355 [Clostridiales bacterium]|nr:hypothetical protein [Clostridiales bacterium]